MIRVIAFLSVLATTAAADWKGRAIDDGAYFYGVATSVEAGMGVRCIGRSAGGKNPVEVEAHETSPTTSYSMRFEIDPRILPVGTTDRRSDLLAWSDAGGVRLPQAFFNAMWDVWEFELPMTDPFVVSLFSTSRLVFGPEAGPHYDLTVAGLAPALTIAFQHCIANYQRMGLPVPETLSAFAPTVQPPTPAARPDSAAMAGQANLYMERSCGGVARPEPGYLLTAQIDDDGQMDAVLDWSKITCANGGRPFCGASMCSADVFLSRLYPAKAQPEALLAVGVSIEPLSNGLSSVVLGGSLSSCSQFGLSACQGLWYWTGSDLQLLQTRPVQ